MDQWVRIGFWVLTGVMGLVGVWALVSDGVWRARRGRERCPSCWHDLSGRPDGVLVCPECGRDARRESRLRRPRRRWRVALAAGLVAVLAVVWWPRVYERRREGWSAWVPTTALVIAGRWAWDEGNWVGDRLVTRRVELRSWPGEFLDWWWLMDAERVAAVPMTVPLAWPKGEVLPILIEDYDYLRHSMYVGGLHYEHWTETKYRTEPPLSRMIGNRSIPFLDTIAYVDPTETGAGLAYVLQTQVHLTRIFGKNRSDWITHRVPRTLTTRELDLSDPADAAAMEAVMPSVRGPEVDKYVRDRVRLVASKGWFGHLHVVAEMMAKEPGEYEGTVFMMDVEIVKDGVVLWSHTLPSGYGVGYVRGINLDTGRQFLQEFGDAEAGEIVPGDAVVRVRSRPELARTAYFEADSYWVGEVEMPPREVLHVTHPGYRVREGSGEE